MGEISRAIVGENSRGDCGRDFEGFLRVFSGLFCLLIPLSPSSIFPFVLNFFRFSLRSSILQIGPSVLTSETELILRRREDCFDSTKAERRNTNLN